MDTTEEYIKPHDTKHESACDLNMSVGDHENDLFLHLP